MAERSDISKENTENLISHDESSVTQDQATTPTSPSSSRKRGISNASDTIALATGRLRSASQRILEANVPVGMWSATGTAIAQAPTLGEIRSGSFGEGDKTRTTLQKRYSGGQLLSEAVAEEKAIESGRSAGRARNTDDDITVATEDDDGLPANIFGRPELENQSYIPGQRASAYSQRIPKLAVRKRDSQETPGSLSSETFQDAVESQTTAVASETSTEPFPNIEDDSDLDELDPKPKRKSKNVDMMLGRAPTKPENLMKKKSHESTTVVNPVPNQEGVYPNGYSFPQPKPWKTATRIGFMAFLRFTFTPLGFLIVLYGLNVVAWGGMLFLLLCNASPAMCHLADGSYDCNDIDSPRRVWVEIDSQILNALFCVTGFGLIPWRFRDLYYWIKWRVGKQEDSLRKLAGYHNGWFRLPNSDQLPVKNFQTSELPEDITNPALPLPLKKTPSPPLTGARAPATAFWKLDFVIWAFVWNTFLQAVLSGFMWGENRYDRPSWSTGLFVALACIVAACGGLTQFTEGKKIKKVEGIPLEVHQEYQDVEAGIKGNNVEKTYTKGKEGT